MSAIYFFFKYLIRYM